MKIKAVVFDLGGVVIDIDFQRIFHHWGEATGIEPERIRTRFSMDAAYKKHETGDLSFSQYSEHVRLELGVDLGQEELVRGWNRIFIGPIPGIADVLARVSGRVPLHAFTNTNKTHMDYWSANFGFLMDHFLRVFASCEMGLRKPDPASFEFIAEELNCEPASILFFDDTRENIDGARTAGFETVQVDGPADVTTGLKRYGLILPDAKPIPVP